MKSNAHPPVIFAGVADNAHIRDNFFLDILGISSWLPLIAIPNNLSNRSLILGIHSQNSDFLTNKSVTVRQTGHDLDLISLTFESGPKTGEANEPQHHEQKISGSITKSNKPNPIFFGLNKNYDCYTFLPIPLTGLQVTRQGDYDVVIKSDADEDLLIGQFHINLVKSPELSPDVIASIAKKPGTKDSVVMTFGCTKCDTHAYSGLSLSNPDSIDNYSDQSQIQFGDLDGIWACTCGNVSVDLADVKQSITNLFHDRSANDNPSQTPVPMRFLQMRYKNILSQFADLISTHPNDEGAFQRFFEENEAVWSWLSPYKIINKPKLLTDYVADFGVLDMNQELTLIEIEKPSTRLLTAKGDLAQETSHAMGQTRDWKQLITEKRDACLHTIGLEKEEVRSIRYIVIAGLKSEIKDSRKFNTHIKSITQPDLRLYTFDEMDTLIRAYYESMLFRL